MESRERCEGKRRRTEGVRDGLEKQGTDGLERGMLYNVHVTKAPFGKLAFCHPYPSPLSTRKQTDARTDKPFHWISFTTLAWVQHYCLAFVIVVFLIPFLQGVPSHFVRDWFVLFSFRVVSSFSLSIYL